MYIILEYYLLENFAINFLVIYFTNKVTKSNIRLKRIFWGTLVSTLYALIVFLPKTFFLSGPMFKILISMFIIYISFRSKDIKTFIFQLFCFYIVSFIFAGAILSISSNFSSMKNFFSKNIDLFNMFSIKNIFKGIIVGIVVLIIVFTNNYKKKYIESLLVESRIVHKNRFISLKAFIDTGNTLRDPLSNKPVFVVELDKLRPLLPKELIDYYDNPCDANTSEIIIGLRDSFPLLLIPFRSIGNENGMILGFKPDNVVLKISEESIIETNKIIIGIHRGSLSNEGDFSGLLDYDTIVLKEEI